ncbi:MAG: indolepyruvate ferredoxin oxidoreductase family protein, partial [Sphingobium sp.]
MTAMAGIDTDYRLEDRYTRDHGRVFLSGSQALVRLPMMQRQRDLAAGLNTAGFISGYTGSPLGGYDIALKQVPDLLQQHHIHFEPGINEDMGATAVWGSQQVHLAGQARYDGVFGIWYGKGPGVDRSGDALKHGSYSGSAPNGGVLVLAGDDHGAKSSTIAHQSDHAFIHFGMPYFNPATVQDYLDYGLHGFALSRHSGCWVAMKCVTDTIESSASVDVDPGRVTITLPVEDEGRGTRNTRWAVPAIAAEKRHYQERLPAVLAYVRANGLNRTIIDTPARTLGIVTSGKAFLDVMQAIEELGLSEADCAALGLSLMKIAMPWPLEPDAIRAFATGHRELLVVEEKRPVIEEQIARQLINLEHRPALLGKQDLDGRPLVPAEGELTPRLVARIVGERIVALTGDARAAAALDRIAREDAGTATGGASLVRLPSFCAGCPHNRSTKLPDGSMAFGGIGCHGMATFLPERNTTTLFQMGGEGASWIGMSPFTDRPHIFQNLGDGTYYHSGLMAIRAAAAAGVNITYKILVNDAIAMTGGQEIAGKMRIDVLTRQLEAEGVRAIAVVSDRPDDYPKDAGFAPGTTIHHRDELDAVQRRLRELPGV